MRQRHNLNWTTFPFCPFINKQLECLLSYRKYAPVDLKALIINQLTTTTLVNLISPEAQLNQIIPCLKECKCSSKSSKIDEVIFRT